MKNLTISLLLNSVILFGNLSHGSGKIDEEDVKIVHRLNVGFHDARSLSIELINCSPTVTFTSSDPNLKIIDVAGKRVPGLKTTPIHSTDLNNLMLVPDLKEEDNLLNKPYIPFHREINKESIYYHSTNPLVVYIPKSEVKVDYQDEEENYLANEIDQQQYYFKVKAFFENKNYSKWFSFQSFLEKYIVIEKDNTHLSISMRNKIYHE